MKKFAFLLIGSILLVAGCTEESLNGNGYSACSDQCSSEAAGDVEDKSGSIVSGYDYIDLVQGCSVSIAGTTITCVIKVADIPDSGELTFNHTALADNRREYNWAVSFDEDKDGTYEYQLSVCHFKFPGSSELIGEISAYTQENLWKKNGTSWSSLTNATLDIDTTADTFTIQATHAEVSNITSSADILVETNFDDGSDSAAYKDCCAD